MRKNAFVRHRETGRWLNDGKKAITPKTQDSGPNVMAKLALLTNEIDTLQEWPDQAYFGTKFEFREDPYEDLQAEDPSDHYPEHNLELQDISEGLAAEIQGLTPRNHGVDFITDTRLTELKNWASHVHLTPRRFVTHVLRRFVGTDPHHAKEWVLVIACAPISRWAKILIRAYGIRLVWIRPQLTTTSPPSVKETWRSALLGLFNTTTPRPILRRLSPIFLILSRPVLGLLTRPKSRRLQKIPVLGFSRPAVAIGPGSNRGPEI